MEWHKKTFMLSGRQIGWYHATKIALVGEKDQTIQNRTFPSM